MNLVKLLRKLRIRRSPSKTLASVDLSGVVGAMHDNSKDIEAFRARLAEYAHGLPSGKLIINTYDKNVSYYDDKDNQGQPTETDQDVQEDIPGIG